MIKAMAEVTAEVDVASSLGMIAKSRGFAKPEITAETVFHVQEGKHPVLSQINKNSFTPNHCQLDGSHIWMISGPNMGGKCHAFCLGIVTP